MHHNKFDRLVRDRLLDHSSPFRADLWKDVRRNYGRQMAPRRWWWAAAGAMPVMILLIAHHFVSRPAGSPVKIQGAPSVGSTNVDRSFPVAAHSSPDAAHSSPDAAHSPAAADAAYTVDAAASKAGATTSRSIRDGHADAHTGGLNGVPTVATGVKTVRTAHRLVRKGRPGAGPDGDIDEETGIAISGSTRREYTNARSGGTDSRVAGAGRVILPLLSQLASRRPVTANQLRPALPAKSMKPPSDFNSMWHLDIYGSPDYPTAQFNLSYTFGVRMTMLLTKHIFATVGMQYSRLRPKRIDSTADLYPAYFNNIDLPLLVGYTFENDRFHGAVTAGAIVNLFSHAAGNPGWGWPNRMGASVYLGFDLSHELSDRLAVFAEPYGRCMFTDHKSLFPGQTFTAGTLIGIRYNFMRR